MYVIVFTILFKKCNLNKVLVEGILVIDFKLFVESYKSRNSIFPPKSYVETFY